MPIAAGRQMTPGELADAVAYAQQHRQSSAAFDVVVSGAGSEPAAYAEAGATWWMEDISPWRFGADPEAPWNDGDTAAMERRITEGPPR